jgi:molybdopterin-guanine dinucleotide biosynthesis protein A
LERTPSGLTGIVLMGGQSSRFGRDKAAVRFRGEPFLAWVVGALGAVCEEIIVVAAPNQDVPGASHDRPVSIARDPTAHEGPLAGLLTGMELAREEWIVVASCDVPLVQPALLELMAARRTEAADAILPDLEGRLQPFPALVRARALPALRELFAGGERRIGRALERVEHVAVPEADLRKADADLRSFMNVNSPDDLARLEAALSLD